jgi:hypothetical protein
MEDLFHELFSGRVRRSPGKKLVLPHNVTEGKLEGTSRRDRRCKQLLHDLKKMRIDWDLKEEALDRSL